MSNFLISAIFALCPGKEYDSKGQIITNKCQEWMTNCMVTEAGTNEPTRKEFSICAKRHLDKVRSGHKIVPSELE